MSKECLLVLYMISIRIWGNPSSNPGEHAEENAALYWDPGLFSVPMVLIHPHFFVARPILGHHNPIVILGTLLFLDKKRSSSSPTEYGTILENPVNFNYPLVK